MKAVHIASFVALMLFVFVPNNAPALQTTPNNAVVELDDGTEFEAELLGVRDEISTFRIDEATKTVPVDSISRIRFAKSDGEVNDSLSSVTLLDGSELLCDSLEISNQKLVGKIGGDIDFCLSIRLVDHIRFSSGLAAGMWKRTVEASRESDALVVLRDQKLETVEGVVGDVSKDTVSFTAGERTADIKLKRLSGMLFYRRIVDEFSPAAMVMKLGCGSRVQVRSMKIENDLFFVSSVAGAKFELDANAIAEINFEENRSISLTDLDPATNDWVPLLTSAKVLKSLKQFSIARINKSYSGKPLSILSSDEHGSFTRKEYRKGFAIKGGGKLSFLLAKQYRELTGKIAFDPDANSAGHVRLLIQVDGSNRVSEILEASVLDQPFAVDVDLRDAERIVFRVDYHDRRSVGDILHAVEMKLHR